MSIRLRLTLWYGVTFALLIGLAGLGVWWQFDSSLRRSLQEAVRIHAEDIESGLEQGGDPLQTLEPPRPGIFAVLVGAGDVVLDVGPGTPAGLGPSGRPGGSVVLPGVPAGLSVRQLTVDGPSYLLYGVTVPDGRMLVAGSSLVEVDRSARSLAELLTLIGLACAAGSLLGGWWLAGRALGPMRDMTREADAIDAADLGRRLPVANAGDEIGHLAGTLNRLLARVEDGVTRERAFINGAAHDLRTPLAALRMRLDLVLRSARVDDPARSAIEEARNDAVALGELADALLGLADAQAAGPHDAVADHVLPMLVARAEQDVESIAHARSVHIDERVAETSVRVSEVRFHQALSNLLLNAVRHGPVGGTVVLDAHVDSSVPSRGPVVLVEIADRGPGIAEDRRDRLFQPFAMSRPDSTAHGLGLATAAVAVRSQGGDIGYRDRSGGGSVFWFWLPIVRHA
jgi:signal transduction histidine kinase